MFNIAQAREEFAAIHAEATTFATDNGERDWTEEEQAAQDARFAKLDAITQRIARAEQLARYKLNAGDPTVTVGGSKSDAQRAAEGDESITPTNFSRDKFAGAFNAWLATGDIPAQFATITTTSQSGLFLPKQVLAPVVPTVANVFRAAHALHGVTPLVTDRSDDLNLPILTAGAGSVIAENANTETENAPGLTDSLNLKPAMYQSGTTWYSDLTLGANGFDLIEATIPSLVESKEQALETAIVNAMVADNGVTRIVESGTYTGITYEALVDLNRALPRIYDRQKVILLSDDAFSFAEKLRGTDGQPILNRDAQNQELLRFNGTPVLRTEKLANFDIDNSVVIGLIVSLVGFRLRDVRKTTLQRYVGVPNRGAQTGINLFAPHGFGYAKSAVAKLVSAHVGS